MLVAVRLLGLTYRCACSRHPRLPPAPALLLLLLTPVFAPLMLTGCNRASATGIRSGVVNPGEIEDARRQMQSIPLPSKSQYLAVPSLSAWQNPYLTVQENMVTLHVMIADANPSEIGEGGIMRPLGARRQNINVRLSELPAALSAVPENTWPYGRVVAIEEAHDTPSAARPQVRRTLEAAIKTLSDLGIVVDEWNETGNPQP